MYILVHSHSFSPIIIPVSLEAALSTKSSNPVSLIQMAVHDVGHDVELAHLAFHLTQQALLPLHPVAHC
jgi:hypothetical protein